MVRTSFLLPPGLHQALLVFARQEHKPVAQIIREMVQKTLAERQKARLKRMYDALDRLDGVGQKGVTEASTTINETLYGEHGAWRPVTQ